VLDELFQRTQTAARAGAEIVAWSEAAGYTFKEDEAALLQRAAAVARAESIYLEVGLVVILPTAAPPQVENRSVLLGPDGATLWDYDKATLVPGDGNLPGKDALPVVSTPFGRLSAVICFDADFPWLVRQAGKAGVDVLLVPSSDWGPVGGVHADMAAFRAIENGVSILRPTRQGRSVAFDPYGRTLARLDTLQAEQQTMTVTLPARRVATGYAVLGDLVGWGSTAVVLVLAGAGVVGLVRRRRADRA
jgi:apolipoprotein N-acyltransferase